MKIRAMLTESQLAEYDQIRRERRERTRARSSNRTASPIVMSTGVAAMIRAGFGVSLLSSVLAAQSSTGVLTGTIYDQAGARLDRALVTVKNADSGVEHSVQPNSEAITGSIIYRWVSIRCARRRLV